MSKIFGEPNKGVHAHRLFGVAIVDVALTAVAAGLIALKSQNKFLTFIIIFIILILAGIALHEYFGVNTKLNSILFNRPYLFE